MRFQDLRAPQKLALAFTAVLGAIVAIGAVMIVNLLSLARTDATATRAQATLSALDDARFSLARQENSLRGYLLTNDVFYVQRIESTHRPGFIQAMATLERLNADDPAVRADIARVRRTFEAWRQQGAVPAETLAADPDKRAQAVAMIGHDGLADRLMEDVEAALRTLEEPARAAAAQTMEAKLRAARILKVTLVLGIMIVAGVAATMGILLARDMGGPIVALTGAMRRLAAGDNTVAIPAVERGDEIGQMAGAVLTFREAAVAKAALEAEAEDRRRETQALAIQAQAASRAKSAFLATMAHELRTPLNGILGMTQIMAGHDLAADQKDRLKIIETSGQTLLGVINDVLDISQIEAGRLEIHPAPFDLGRLCDELRALYGALAGEKGLDFTLSATPQTRAWLQGDVVRLRQITGNLISNALKFTDSGSVDLTVDYRDGRLVFAVADTGVGVPLDMQAGLFDRFVQADAGVTRRHGGSGLGLAICRDLLTLMDGRIDFTSRPGAGSTFRFEVPLPPADRTRAPPPANDEAAPAGAPMRVLVADDNATNRLVIRSLLEHFMITSETVENGLEALVAWENGTWDAILMDIHMPEMDGVTATAAIRRRERELGRPKVPIIAVTASVLAHETASYLSAGMDGCVPKPIDAQTMLAALQDAVEA